MTDFWTDGILERLSVEDDTPSQIVLRAARRVVEKGLSLLDYTRQAGVREGFNWGRSSWGERRCTIWQINFEDADHAEHTITIVAQTIVHVRRNPRDRVPAGSGFSSSMQATDATKAALGWR